VKKNSARLVALFVAVALVSGCRTLAPGADAKLVRAQQTYDTAVATFDTLFVFEDQNQPVLESKIPGSHAAVEKLRVIARTYLPKLLQAIDAYTMSKAAGLSDLETYLAIIETALDEAQAMLATARTAMGLPTHDEMVAAHEGD
jgi:hypothetical protein